MQLNPKEQDMNFGDRVRKAQQFIFNDDICLHVDPLTGELLVIGGRHLDKRLTADDLEAIRNFCLAIVSRPEDRIA